MSGGRRSKTRCTARASGSVALQGGASGRVRREEDEKKAGTHLRSHSVHCPDRPCSFIPAHLSPSADSTSPTARSSTRSTGVPAGTRTSRSPTRTPPVGRIEKTPLVTTWAGGGGRGRGVAARALSDAERGGLVEGGGATWKTRRARGAIGAALGRSGERAVQCSRAARSQAWPRRGAVLGARRERGSSFERLVPTARRSVRRDFVSRFSSATASPTHHVVSV